MRRVCVGATVTTVLLGSLLMAAPRLEEKVNEDQIQEVRVHPSHLVFSAVRQGRSVLVTGVTSAGTMVDLT